MTKYRNKKTGAIIDSSFALTGSNWEIYSPKKEESENELLKEKDEIKKENISKEIDSKKATDSNKLTKAELIQELKAFGIEYDESMTKSQLIELLK